MLSQEYTKTFMFEVDGTQERWDVSDLTSFDNDDFLDEATASSFPITAVGLPNEVQSAKLSEGESCLRY
jgi:hypothetical protein